MKTKKIFSLLTLCVLLSGCFALTPYSMNKIQTGMCESDVRDQMGRPYSTQYGNNKKFYVYYLHHDIFDFFINQKKFPFFGFYPLLRTGHEYYVVFNDEKKVISYGRADKYKGSIQDMSDKDIKLMIDSY